MEGSVAKKMRLYSALVGQRIVMRRWRPVCAELYHFTFDCFSGWIGDKVVIFLRYVLQC